MLFYMPTKLYSEADCVEKHRKEIATFGTKAMIVTGRNSARRNGSLQDLEDALKAEGVSYIVFDEVEENPSIETVMKAREIGVCEKVDFVIGIGGGSPLDASKAIALMIANPNDGEEILYCAVKKPCLPVVCIPTTCGTGSEVTPYSILTIHKQRTKKSISHKIFPELALLDIKYLKSLNREGIVNTAVDALGHLLESYLNTNANVWNQVYSREGFIVWGQIRDCFEKDELSDEDYEKLFRASSLAGMAISHTGTSLPHGLSYALTYELGIPHGRAVGYYLAGFVSSYKDAKEVQTVLELLGFESVEAFVTYMKNLLGDMEVSKEVNELSAAKVSEDSGKLKNYPFEVTKEEIINMAGTK